MGIIDIADKLHTIEEKLTIEKLEKFIRKSIKNSNKPRYYNDGSKRIVKVHFHSNKFYK